MRFTNRVSQSLPLKRSAAKAAGTRYWTQRYRNTVCWLVSLRRTNDTVFFVQPLVILALWLITFPHDPPCPSWLITWWNTVWNRVHHQPAYRQPPLCPKCPINLVVQFSAAMNARSCDGINFNLPPKWPHQRCGGFVCVCVCVCVCVDVLSQQLNAPVGWLQSQANPCVPLTLLVDVSRGEEERGKEWRLKL